MIAAHSVLLAAVLSSVATARPDIAAPRAVQGGVLAGAPVNDIRVSSDDVVQCSQATISWSGATAPVTLQVGTGGYYVGVDWLDSFSGVSDSSYGWTVDQAAGTSLIFQVTDAKGQVAYQQNVYVGGSGDSSCLGSGPVVTASTTSEWSAPASTGGSGGSNGSGATTSPAWSPAASSDAAAASSKSTKSKKAKSSSSAQSSASATGSSAALPSPSAIIIASGVSPSNLASSRGSAASIAPAASVPASASASSSGADAALAQAQASQTGAASSQAGIIGGSMAVLGITGFSILVGALAI